MLHTHSRYAYSNITTRPDYSWPTGKRLAVYVALNIEQFSYGAGKGAAIAPPDQATSHSIFGCVPPFTHGILNRAVRLMRPAVIRDPYDVQPHPPS